LENSKFLVENDSYKIKFKWFQFCQ
jgi:hypothetical protein